jgi:hypothetical protein
MWPLLVLLNLPFTMSGPLGSLRWVNHCTVPHDIPFVLGSTGDTITLRAMAEIKCCIKVTSRGTDTISATMAIFIDSLTTDKEHQDQQIIIKLPASQTNSEKSTYFSTSFCNLKTAMEPIREDFAKHLLMSLIEDLNRLFPMDLVRHFVCDR